MPKVTEAYREARRDEIARAALRCLERKGVRDTSIADIVEESGLSTGAIYSHFSNKAELARYIAGRYLIPRLDALESATAEGRVLTPSDVLRAMLSVFRDTGLPPALVVQFWGEAMVEPQLHAEMLRTAGRLRGALTTTITPWARTRTDSDTEADAFAGRLSRTIAALAQGYVSNTAVFGPRDIDEYVDDAIIVLGC